MNLRPPSSRARRAAVRLELTSMIDVIFLLLVYFILSTTYQAPESQLTPALRTRSDATGRSAELTPQILDVGIIAGSPGFSIGSRLARTREELRAILRGLSHEEGIIVRGSPAASVGLVAAAIQACRDENFAKVTYVPGA